MQESLDGSRDQHALCISSKLTYRKVAFHPAFSLTSTLACTIIYIVYYHWPVKFPISCATHAHVPLLTLIEHCPLCLMAIGLVSWNSCAVDSEETTIRHTHYQSLCVRCTCGGYTGLHLTDRQDSILCYSMG